MTNEQIRSRIMGALSTSMMPTVVEKECLNFIDRAVKVFDDPDELVALVEALRCSAGTPPDSCDGCRYRMEEPVPEEFRETLGRDTWDTCDCDRIAVEAAERLERLLPKEEEQ